MKSLDDFFEAINEVLNSSKFKDCSLPVYRGHSKESHELLPTLIRDYQKTNKDLWTFENNLYGDFCSLVGPRVKFESSWETLFAMRHEGIPTRLLDWTENIGTALFFAFDSYTVNKPHIWILNPYALNKKNDKIKDTLLNPEEDMKLYHETYANKCINDSVEIDEWPLAIYPRRTNERMFAQRGLFTIHGSNNQKMEDTCHDCLEKIEIPIELSDKLRNLLRQFGINKYSVYPDFKGLADYLKVIYQY